MRLTPLVSDLNIRKAASLAKHFDVIDVRAITRCHCGAEAKVNVRGFIVCEPCANDIVNKWNEIRANLDEVKGEF